MPTIDTVFRTDPGSGQSVGVFNATDPFNSTVTAVKLNRSVNTTAPLSLIQIGTSISNPNDFPNDGGGTITNPTGSGGTLTGITINPVGLLIVLTTGTQVGQVRKIVGFTAGTGIFTVSPAWSPQPAAGVAYTLLIDSTWLSTAYVATAFSTNTVPLTITYQLMFYDNPAPFQGVRGPFTFMDTPVQIENYGFTNASVNQTGYFNGRGYSVGTGGYMGFKVHLSALAAGAVVTLCAGAS